jgi:hypothetical protein
MEPSRAFPFGCEHLPTAVAKLLSRKRKRLDDLEACIHASDVKKIKIGEQIAKAEATLRKKIQKGSRPQHTGTRTRTAIASDGTGTPPQPPSKDSGISRQLSTRTVPHTWAMHFESTRLTQANRRHSLRGSLQTRAKVSTSTEPMGPLEHVRARLRTMNLLRTRMNATAPRRWAFDSLYCPLRTTCRCGCGENVLIVWGNGGFGPASSGHDAPPNKRLRRLLSKWVPVGAYQTLFGISVVSASSGDNPLGKLDTAAGRGGRGGPPQLR